ncbi:MAG: sensor histidine kinase [Spirochaetota bacterium]
MSELHTREQRRELLGLLYDAADVGMCVTDEHRRFVTVNRAYQATYGYSEEELIGKEFTMVLPEADREEAARTHDRFLSGESDETTGEWTVQRKDGQLRDVLVTAGRLVTEDGARYKVTTVYDITDRNIRRRQMEEEVEKRKLMLREVHHRVKNNLSSLEGMLQLQMQSRADDAHLVEILTESINRIKTMGRLYDRLNDTPDSKVVELHTYFEDLVKELVETAGDPSRIRAETDIAHGSTDIDTAITLGLITNELVTNSLKHAVKPADNRTQTEPTTIRVVLHADEEGYALEVSDTGGGLPPDFLTYSRTSLGIQLITAVVEQHRGTFELADPAASLFRVRLPRNQAAPPAE